MPSVPWWIERVDRLLETSDLTALAAGPLWHLSERLQFIRENVELALLPLDFDGTPGAQGLWSAFEVREGEVLAALAAAVAKVALTMREGGFAPGTFRSGWETLGFAQNAEGAATPADDYLDALFQVSRLTLGEPRPASGLLNMASRAERIADFLGVFEPGVDDLVYDLGSGNGKVALTVAASSLTRVRGVELGLSYVTAARASVGLLGLGNLEFLHADVREVDLSGGTVFYLYYPFHGAVARTVAETLGRLAREKDIRLYVNGPALEFGEHFLREVERGSLHLSERRGAFSEVMVLRSAHD